MILICLYRQAGAYLEVNSWYKKIFHNPLEKVITVAWAMWNHMDNVIFRNYTCNPVSIVEHADL